jgi:hypothetical protein
LHEGGVDVNIDENIVVDDVIDYFVDVATISIKPKRNVTEPALNYFIEVEELVRESSQDTIPE